MEIGEKQTERKNEVESLLKENNMILDMNHQDISSDIKTLIYNTDKINEKLKESNMYLERISWRTGLIIFLLALPIIIKIIIICLKIQTIKQIIEMFPM